MSSDLDQIPDHLRDGFDAALNRFWIEQKGHPPLPGENNEYERCRCYFACGVGLRLDGPVGDGYLEYDIPEILPDALFAGHTWRIRFELQEKLRSIINDALGGEHEMGCPAEWNDEAESEHCDCGVTAGRRRARTWIQEFVP